MRNYYSAIITVLLISAAYIYAEKFNTSKPVPINHGNVNINGDLVIGDGTADRVDVTATSWTFVNQTTIAFTADDSLITYSETNVCGKLFFDYDGNQDLLFTSAPAETDAAGWVTVSSNSVSSRAKAVLIKVLCLNSQDGTGENASLRLAFRRKWSNAYGNTGVNAPVNALACDARVSLANERSRDLATVIVPISTDSLRSFEYQCLNEDGVGTTGQCDGYLAGVCQ